MIHCRECGKEAPKKTMTEVYGCPGEFRCWECMRDRKAACFLMCEARGEKHTKQRGHSEKSAFRKKPKGCEACGETLSGKPLCDPCRAIGEACWARELAEAEAAEAMAERGARA